MCRITKACVALNNYGVNMLSSHSYKQGHQTLKQAVELVKLKSLGASPDTPSSGEDIDNETAVISTALKEATKRLSNPTKSAVHLPELTAISDVEDLPRVCSRIQPHATGQGVVAAALALPASSATNLIPAVYPIRIEATEFHDDACPEVCLNLLSAMIVYNCGLSYVCRAEVADTMEDTGKLRRCALKVFTLAVSILAMCDESNYEVLHIAILVYSAVARTLLISGRTKEAKKAMSKLSELKQAAQEHSFQEEGPLYIAASAA